MHNLVDDITTVPILFLLLLPPTNEDIHLRPHSPFTQHDWTSPHSPSHPWRLVLGTIILSPTPDPKTLSTSSRLNAIHANPPSSISPREYLPLNPIRVSCPRASSCSANHRPIPFLGCCHGLGAVVPCLGYDIVTLMRLSSCCYWRSPMNCICTW